MPAGGKAQRWGLQTRYTLNPIRPRGDRLAPPPPFTYFEILL